MFRSSLLAIALGLTLAGPLLAPAAAQEGGEGEEELSPAQQLRQEAFEKVKARDYAGAIERFKKSLELDPGHPDTLFHVGQMFHAQGKLAEAISYYDKAIYSLPGHHMAYHNRGVARSALGKLKEALEDLDESILLRPQYSRGWHSRAQVHIMLGNDEEAVADCSEAIKRSPKFASAWHSRAIARMRLGQIKEAEQDVVEACSQIPGVATWVFRRGFARMRLGKLDEALADYTRAIEMEAKSAEGKQQRPLSDYMKARAYSSRAQVYFLQGQQEKSLADMAASMKLTPDHAYSPLWLRAFGGEAEATLERLAKHDYESDDDKWIQQILRYYTGEIDRPKLLGLAERAEEEQGRRERLCQAHCYAGMLHEAKGEPAEAKAQYKLAVAQKAYGYTEHWWAETRLQALK